MRIAFDGLTALRVLRACRSGLAGDALKRAFLEPMAHMRAGLLPPDPGPSRHAWTAGLIKTIRIGSWNLPDSLPIEVAVPRPESRIQSSAVRCALRSSSVLPDGAFLSLGDGIQIPCPELLFLELSCVLDPFALQLLGCELCGRYGRDPLDPRDGDTIYGLKPLTTVADIRRFIANCGRMRGKREALLSLEHVFDEAWSPMEAVIAIVASRPVHQLGYGLSPVVLNRRTVMPEGATKETRVPDMLLAGTDVGLNYEGEGHLDLQVIVDAAVRAERVPGDPTAAFELVEARQRLRRKYLDDRRRDRELGASGHVVFPVTKEDLDERGGLDRVMLLAMEAMSWVGAVDVRAKKRMLNVGALPRQRQDLIWMSLPGRRGRQATKRYLERRRARERGNGLLDFDASDSRNEISFDN